jgi:hypothetical protein
MAPLAIANAAITQRPLMAASSVTKIYDATTVAGTVTVGTVSNLVSPETLVITGVATAYSGSNVGSYNATITYTLANGPVTGLASNYSMANLTIANATITPRDVTITANPQSKVVNTHANLGTIAFTVAPATATTGLVGGQTITNVTLSSTGATAGAAVGNYPILVTSPTGTFNIANYNVIPVSGFLSVYVLVNASVSVTASATTVCQGTPVTFTAAPTNGGPTPVYTWFNGSTSVGTGATYTYTPTVGNTDAITVSMFSNDPSFGLAGATVTSTPAMTITVNPALATPTVTLATGTLTSSAATGNQWWNCSTTPATMIAGATNATFTPTASGSYRVMVTNGPCSATSTCTTVTVPTLQVAGFDSKSFSYYPNPVSSELNLSYSKDITSVKVVNVLGQVMSRQSNKATTATVDMSSLPSGMYMIEVQSEKESKTIKVMKK